MDHGIAQQTDRVVLRQIPFNIKIGQDAWGRDKPQPVLLSLEIPYDFQKAAATDDVSHTLDYGKLYKSLTSELGNSSENAAELALRIRDVLQPGEYFLANIVLPKGNLRAEGGLHFAFEFQAGERPGEIIVMQSLSIKGIRCPCIVGVNPHEREEKQIVVVNLDVKKVDIINEDHENLHDFLYSGIEGSFPYASMIRKAVKVSISRDSVVINIADHDILQEVEASTYQTVEALATAIAKTITMSSDIPGIWVEVEKPNAIAAIEAAGVRIYREKSFFSEKNFWQIRQP